VTPFMQVRSLGLRSLGESVECLVLTSSSLFRPVFFLIPLWESVEGLVVVIVILLAAKVLVQVVAVHHHMNGTRRTWELSFLRVMRQTGTATSLTLTNLTAPLRTLTTRRSCPTRSRSSSNTAGHIRRRRFTGSAFFLYSRISCASR
jgi:hypothetical protein